jgi:hypothetical protein
LYSRVEPWIIPTNRFGRCYLVAGWSQNHYPIFLSFAQQLWGTELKASPHKSIAPVLAVLGLQLLVAVRTFYQLSVMILPPTHLVSSMANVDHYPGDLIHALVDDSHFHDDSALNA